MKLQKIFYKSQCLLYLGICVLISPLFSTASPSKIDLLKDQISEHENFVANDLRKLESCRTNCVAECRDSYYSFSRQCTADRCDSGECESQKAKHDREEQTLNNFKTSLAELEGQEDAGNDLTEGSDNESPLKQVQRERNNQKIYGILGAGATAYLGFKAKRACTGCVGGCGPSCPLYIGLTLAAYDQTQKIFNKMDDLKHTERTMCDDKAISAGVCGGGGDPSPGPALSPKVPPWSDYCQDNPSLCNSPIMTMFPPDGENPCGATGCFPGTGTPRELLEAIEPPGGFPDDTDPLGNPGFSYEQLTPAQKKQVNRMMEPLNRRNEAFLTAMGMGEDADDEAEGEAENMDDIASGKDMLASFTGEDDSQRLIAAGPLEEMSGTGKKKDSLANQMQEMLKKFYGSGGSSGDSEKEKSVQFGSDVVGVVEDNIFMMVHRRHRALDKGNRFIRALF